MTQFHPAILLLIAVPGASPTWPVWGRPIPPKAPDSPVSDLAEVLDDLRVVHDALFEVRTWTLESSQDGVGGDLAAVARSLVDEALGGGEVPFSRVRSFVDRVGVEGEVDESLDPMRALVRDTVQNGDALTVMKIEELRVASLFLGDRVLDYQSGIDRIRWSSRQTAGPRGLLDLSRLIAPLSLHPESVEWLRGDEWVLEEGRGGVETVQRWSRPVQSETSGSLRIAFDFGEEWPRSVLDRVATPLGEDAGAVLTLFRTAGWGLGLEDPRLLEVVRLDTFEREGAVRVTHAVVHQLCDTTVVGQGATMRLPVRFTERTQLVDATAGGPPQFLGTDVQSWPEEILTLLLSE